MKWIVLHAAQHVREATEIVEGGEAIWVSVGFEEGPDGPEPMVEVLRLLLDQVQRRFAVIARDYVPHPTVSARYLQSCLIQPTPPRRPMGGVREPRSPSPAPIAGAATVELPDIEE